MDEERQGGGHLGQARAAATLYLQQAAKLVGTLLEGQEDAFASRRGGHQTLHGGRRTRLFLRRRPFAHVGGRGSLPRRRARLRHADPGERVDVA